MASTNEQRIIDFLAEHGENCDDCISKNAKISPRQQVNQICRRLETQGKLIRTKRWCSPCAEYKLINRLS